MNGRTAFDTTNWGGHARLTDNFTTAAPTDLNAPLFRARLPQPMLVEVQAAATPVTVTAEASANTVVSLDLGWQSGRGTLSATVDVGIGTTFTLAASEFLQVSARLRNAARPWSTAVPLNNGTQFFVDAVAAPAQNSAPRPANMVHVTTSIAAGVAGTADETLLIPAFARTVTIMPRTANTSHGDVASVRFDVQNAFGTGLVSFTGPGPHPIPPNGVLYAVRNNATNAQTLWLMWEIWL